MVVVGVVAVIIVDILTFDMLVAMVRCCLAPREVLSTDKRTKHFTYSLGWIIHPS